MCGSKSTLLSLRVSPMMPWVEKQEGVNKSTSAHYSSCCTIMCWLTQQNTSPNKFTKTHKLLGNISSGGTAKTAVELFL